ncbi:tripartite tricarboxylate transporter substrate-binding protein [Fodinicurvata sp. EGI_FJ10296]|uniref:tripartite tricarboxylate transporter substrate-binding protein n=1 Tax=Fodinicurvata sp. EGI_FJ10296 TaxID=3231908 RepID=UPI00345124C7
MSIRAAGTVAAIAMMAGAATTASAQEFPSEPIEIIVPYTAGSNMDRYARASAPILGRILDVPVVVQNIPGATGWNHIYQAEPDGYTIGVGEQTGQIGIGLLEPLPYDIEAFTWFGHFATGNQMMVLSNASDFETPEDLKDSDRPVRCGTFGGLSAGAMQCAMLAGRWNFPLAFVNVPGPGEMPVAALRGDIDIASVGVNLWLDYIADGSVTPIVNWAEDRDERAPDVDGLADLDMADLAGITVFRAVMGTPEIPADRVAILREALTEVANDPEWHEFIESGNLDDNYYFEDDYQDIISSVIREVDAQAELIQGAF